MSDPLRAYRERHRMTQKKIAGKLGVSRQMVSFLENGEREYTADMALLIEKRLGIDRAEVRPDLFARAA